MAIAKIKEGITDRSNAIHFVGEIEIQRAIAAHARVLSINGIVIDFEASVGIRKTKRVIPKYATISPPNIAQSVLKRPIRRPLFSGVERVLYIFLNIIKIPYE